MRLIFLSIILMLAIHAETLALQNDKHSDAVTKIVGEKTASTYVCPMHSHIVRDEPGNCPICGMDLVLRNRSIEHSEINVSGNMQQAMAITIEEATRGTLWRFVKTFGSIQLDETKMRHIHPRASGWIEKLHVNVLGQRVKKGDLLYEIYSPELLVAQEDFLALIRSSAASKDLIVRGKSRLALLGMDISLVNQLVETRKVIYSVPYYAQQSAIVTSLFTRQGMYIEPQNEIMTLADLSTVWVVADVLEQQLDWVETGKWVELDIPGLGLFDQEAQLDFIYPILDSKTRTLKVRFSLANPEQRLKPNMLATVRIYGGPLRDIINIPIQALIQTGKQNRVIVRTKNNTFEQREVVIGAVTQGRAQVFSGVNEGDEVVTSGQFLIDAEASLSNMTVSDAPQQQHH